MEEKKKTNGLIIALSIIELFIIVILGIYIFKISDEKNNEIRMLSNINNEVSNMQSTVNQLQEKIESNSNIINSNISETDVKSDSTNKVIENTTVSNEKVNKSTKEIYKRTKTEGVSETELKYYNEKYIVIEDNKIYFSDDLSNKILESTYTIDSNNNIEYNMPESAQDFAFYGGATYRFETINGKKNIVLDCDPHGKMYFEKE